MGRANIDLSWLASLLTKIPTASDNANTPDLDPGSEGKFLDPSGTLHGNTIDVDNPYQPATTMQHLVWPEQSGQIDKLNSEYSYKPLAAAQDNRVALNVRAGNVGLMDPSLRPNTSPLAAAASGYGSLDTSPSYINQQNEALLTAQHGLPGVKAATDLNTGQYNLNASKGAVDRQNMEQSVISGDLVNRWNTTYGLTPQQISLAEQQVRADLGFQGSVEQIREKALQNQYEEQSHLIPAQTSLAETQTSNAQNVASEQGNMWPYAKTALDNRMVGDAATSHYIPLMDRFANTIDSNNEIHPFVKNPLGASPFAVQMQSLGDLNGARSGQVIKDSQGKSYTIPPAPPSNIDPLTGGSITPAGALVISSTNGPSVVHDSSGSMAPTVSRSLSSTTLDQPSTDPLDGYNNSRIREAQYQQQHDSSIKLQQLLKKYSADPGSFESNSTKAPITGGGVDVDALTDFMSNNISKMSKDDRKTALSLLHKLQ